MSFLGSVWRLTDGSGGCRRLSRDWTVTDGCRLCSLNTSGADADGRGTCCAEPPLLAAEEESIGLVRMPDSAGSLSSDNRKERGSFFASIGPPVSM